MELRLKVLEEIDSKEEVNESKLGVSASDFDDAVNFLHREGYIRGIFYGDDRPGFEQGAAYLTEKGEVYYNQNKKM